MSQSVQGNLIFATAPASGSDERELVLLARSIRKFGGRLAGRPIWIMGLTDHALSAAALAELEKVEVRLAPIPVPHEARDFPFAAKVYAAGAAEALAQAEGADLLVWMDPDTLILREPGEFILEDDQQLGCRPVQLTLISSIAEQPPDDFWTAIYRECGVRPESAFVVETTVDRQRIRANFNAGLLVVQPQLGLLQAWVKTFERCYRQPFFESFYELNFLYRFFIHQCVLAGCILAMLDQRQIRDFSARVNYPLHLHPKVPVELQASAWEELFTARYDCWDFFERPGWEGVLPLGEPLSGWLHDQLRDLIGS